eukprot:853682-Prorocentrum_minimum.AAC.2
MMTDAVVILLSVAKRGVRGVAVVAEVVVVQRVARPGGVVRVAAAAQVLGRVVGGGRDDHRRVHHRVPGRDPVPPATRKTRRSLLSKRGSAPGEGAGAELHATQTRDALVQLALDPRGGGDGADFGPGGALSVPGHGVEVRRGGPRLAGPTHTDTLAH